MEQTKSICKKAKERNNIRYTSKSGRAFEVFLDTIGDDGRPKDGKDVYDQRIFLDADSAEAPAAEIDLELLHGRRYLEVSYDGYMREI